MSLGCGTRQGLRTLDFEVFIISQILLRVLIFVFHYEIARVGATEGEQVVQLAFGLGLGDLEFVVLPPEPKEVFTFLREHVMRIRDLLLQGLHQIPLCLLFLENFHVCGDTGELFLQPLELGQQFVVHFLHLGPLEGYHFGVLVYVSLHVGD